MTNWSVQFWYKSQPGFSLAAFRFHTFLQVFNIPQIQRCLNSNELFIRHVHAPGSTEGLHKAVVSNIWFTSLKSKRSLVSMTIGTIELFSEGLSMIRSGIFGLEEGFMKNIVETPCLQTNMSTQIIKTCSICFICCIISFWFPSLFLLFVAQVLDREPNHP